MKYFNIKYILYFLMLINTSTSAQELEWIYKIGGVTAEYGKGLAVDLDENIYDISNFMGTVTVANNLSFTTRGTDDILIRKSSSTGILQWVKQIGSKGQDISYDVATDFAENVYVVGTFSDSLFLDSMFILEGSSGLPVSFIIKLNTEGTLLWARKFSSDVSVIAKSVTAGAQEELVITGTFEGMATFGSELSIASNGGNDIFIVKLNGNTGIPIFIRRIGSSDHDYLHEHTRDKLNNIFLIGDFRQMIDLDPGFGESIHNTKGLTDIFLLKMSTSGDFLWAKTYGGTGVDYGHSVITDGSGNVIITGQFSENVRFGSTLQVVQSKGGTDVFLTKLDENGNTLWVNSYGDTANDQGNKVIVNNTGIIYLAGLFRGRVDFDPSFSYNNSSESRGGADAFVALYNQDGSYNDHYSIGGIANEQINDMALKFNGELISTGGFGAIVDFEPGSSETNIFSTGGLDAFLLNIFLCVNPYIKEVKAIKPEICLGERVLIQVVEGYLNSATQWSWQRDSCNNITFASGNFLNVLAPRNTTFFVKGFGGCVVNDECKMVDIKVFKDSLRYQYIDLCEGDTLRIGTNVYTTTGVYVDSLTSISGCDSVVFSEITVYPKFRLDQSFTICPGDTVKVGSSNYTLGGTYTNIFSTIHGCDSIINTTISVLPTIIDNVEFTICQGEIVNIGSSSYGSSGTFIQTSIGENGCEDVLIVKINVLEKNFDQQISLCEGDSLRVGNKIYKTKGLYLDTLISSFGCDSIILSDVVVIKNSTFFGDYAICEGDSIKVGNRVYKNTGNFIDTISNAEGCDSIIFTDIRVYLLSPKVNQELRICEGDSISVGNIVHKTEGIFSDTLLNINGCDSVVSTLLHVSQRLFFLQDEICRGESVSIGDSVFYDTGLYNVYFQNIYGCDSIIVLNLNVKEKVTVSKTYFLCPGDTLIVANSKYFEEGLFSDTLVGTNGCDSILKTTILWNHVTNNLSFQICEGETINVNGTIYSQTGVYFDTIQKADGCDSVLNVTIKLVPKYEKDTIFEICKGESVTVGSGTYFNAGKYSEVLQTINGCDSLIRFEIKIINFVPFFFVVKDTLKAFKIEGANYQWYDCSNGDRVPFLGAVQSEFPFFKSGKFALSVTYIGCTYFSECLDFTHSASDDLQNNIVTLYPNPVTDILEITVGQSEWLMIRDAAGRIVFQTAISAGKNVMNLSDLNSGFYFAELRVGKEIKKIKFIKL